MAEYEAHLQRLHAARMSLAEAAQRLGLVPAKMTDEESRVYVRRRFGCENYPPPPPFPRLRRALRRVWAL